MVVDVNEAVRSCQSCTRDWITQTRHTNTFKLFTAMRPLADVTIALYGMLPRTTRGNLYILVIMDQYSRLGRLITLSNVKSSTIALAFIEKWVFIYGLPKKLLSHNESQFTSRLFKTRAEW